MGGGKSQTSGIEQREGTGERIRVRKRQWEECK